MSWSFPRRSGSSSAISAGSYGQPNVTDTPMNQLIRLCLLAAALGVACACGVSPMAGAAAPKPGAVAWRAIGPGQFGAMFGIGISPHDSKVIVAGGDMGLAFMTRDGGQHWEM